MPQHEFSMVINGYNFLVFMTVLSHFKSAFVVSTHNNPDFRFYDLTKVNSTFRIFSMLNWVLYGSRNTYISVTLLSKQTASYDA